MYFAGISLFFDVGKQKKELPFSFENWKLEKKAQKSIDLLFYAVLNYFIQTRIAFNQKISFPSSSF